MGNEGSTPSGWAMGLDEGGQRRIRNLVAQELRARGLSFELGEDEVVLQSDDEQVSTRPLRPLAEACLFLEPSEWSERIHDAMDTWLVEGDRGHTAQWSDLVRSWPPRDAVEKAGGRKEASAPEPDDDEALLEATLPPSPVPRLKPVHADKEATAPAGGVPSPFARGRDLQPSPRPESVPLSGPPPALVPLLDEEEFAPPPSSPRERRRGGGLRRFGVFLFVAAVVTTTVLEVRAYFVGPTDADFAAGIVDDVLLEAAPLGAVSVVSELDGRLIGVTPLRFLVPGGANIGVFLSSPGLRPKRVRLPTSGALRVELDPIPEDAPTCTLELPGSGVWRYQSSEGDLSNDEGQLVIKDSAVIRIVPGGFGAWMVSCPTEGGSVPVDLRRRHPPTVEARLVGPRGALAYLADQPIGTVPQRWRQSQSFAQVHIRTGLGVYTMRWVALPGITEIRMPTSDDRAPPPTISGSQLPDPVPRFLRELKSTP